MILAVWKPLIEHEVYEHPGDADVHPEGKGPARDGAVSVVASPQAAAQRDDHHGHNYDGKRDMRNQDDKINRAPYSLAEKKNVSRVDVKIDIAREKQRRGDNGRDHAGPMRSDVAAGNHVPAAYQ